MWTLEHITWWHDTVICNLHKNLFCALFAWQSLLVKLIYVVRSHATYKRCCDRQVLSTSVSYVYWTVHHLDTWIKRDQLDVTCFIISLFTAQHVSDVNTAILRSLRLICSVISWVVFLWFNVCWCYVVVVWYPSGYHTTLAKPQCNTNTHRTTAIQPMK